LAKAESTAENLLTALIKMNIKAKKAIKRASILAGQLEKISLSLVIIREKEAAITLKIECAICRLITLRVQNKATQTIEITC
jgi:hypothetical protein